jgi:transcriptional regulator with XRE-family HTH domain
MEVYMDRIRQLRTERGLSQAKLAVVAGMDPATLNRLEQGKGNPNLKTLERVAGALGVEVVDLFPKVSAPYEPTLLNNLEAERRSSVLAEALISSAERWANVAPPASMSEVVRHLAHIDAAHSIARPLAALSDDWATWENRFSAEERGEIMHVVEELRRASEQLLDQAKQYLEHERGEAGDREATREAEELREQIRELTRRISA